MSVDDLMSSFGGGNHLGEDSFDPDAVLELGHLGEFGQFMMPPLEPLVIGSGKVCCIRLFQ